MCGHTYRIVGVGEFWHDGRLTQSVVVIVLLLLLQASLILGDCLFAYAAFVVAVDYFVTRRVACCIGMPVFAADSQFVVVVVVVVVEMQNAK